MINVLAHMHIPSGVLMSFEYSVSQRWFNFERRYWKYTGLLKKTAQKMCWHSYTFYVKLNLNWKYFSYVIDPFCSVFIRIIFACISSFIWRLLHAVLGLVPYNCLPIKNECMCMILFIVLCVNICSGIGFNKWMNASTSNAMDRWSDDVFTHWFNFSFNFFSLALIHTHTSTLWLFSLLPTNDSAFHFVVETNYTKSLALTFESMDAKLHSAHCTHTYKALHSAMDVCLWCEQISTIHERFV